MGGVWRYLCLQGVTRLLIILVTLICKFKITPVPFRSAHEDADL